MRRWNQFCDWMIRLVIPASKVYPKHPSVDVRLLVLEAFMHVAKPLIKLMAAKQKAQEQRMDEMQRQLDELQLRLTARNSVGTMAERN